MDESLTALFFAKLGVDKGDEAIEFFVVNLLTNLAIRIQ